MAFFTKLEMAYHLLKWKAGWDKRDILKATPARIVLPEDGKVEVLDRGIVTGKGFKLAW